MRLVAQLLPFVPKVPSDRCYYEPFLGAASLFLRIRPQRAILGDLNNDLINSYIAVRRSPDLVARYLSSHARENSKRHYYQVREIFNRSRLTRPATAAQAARFIYLNRTCFNGIYRVNRSGNFNVPFGRGKTALFPSLEHLRNVARAFQRATLLPSGFERSLETAGEGDFVYLDPPYPPLNGTAFFRHYTADRFDLEDQESLRAMVTRLAKRGCRVMMTNADTPCIRRLYSGFQMYPLRVTRFVSSQSIKHTVDELVVTTYSTA